MGNLLAGAAMRKITPTMEMIERVAKEVGGDNAYDGIHEDIYVRARVLSDGNTRVLLGSSDLVRFPGVSRQKNNGRIIFFSQLRCSHEPGKLRHIHVKNI